MTKLAQLRAALDNPATVAAVGLAVIGLALPLVLRGIAHVRADLAHAQLELAEVGGVLLLQQAEAEAVEKRIAKRRQHLAELMHVDADTVNVPEAKTSTPSDTPHKLPEQTVPGAA